MDARFRGADESDDDTITCRVASSIMESFFAVSPVRLSRAVSTVAVVNIRVVLVVGAFVRFRRVS